MLPLIISPEDILRLKATSVPLPPQPEIVALAQEMLAAMTYYKGIGLAAPQVNQSVRLIVVATAGGSSAFVNPEIIKSSWRKLELEEGCLSIPDVFGLVKRPARILARYHTLAGEIKEEWLTEMVARIYQHEVDHLNGVLFTDKTSKITQGQQLLTKYGLV